MISGLFLYHICSAGGLNLPHPFIALATIWIFTEVLIWLANFGMAIHGSLLFEKITKKLFEVFSRIAARTG
jgi:hypothetical protein